MSKDRKPVIAVTFGVDDDQYLPPYVEAVERYGGEPRVLRPDGKPAGAGSLDGVSGLMFTGGEDVDPSLYGQSEDPEADGDSDPERDSMEAAVLKAALERDMPVLAICRGMQLLNIVEGGTLIQHVGGHREELGGGEHGPSFHSIDISPDSKLACVVGVSGTVQVNSIHHQAVMELQKAPNLLATAYSPKDRVIEALESPDHAWVIGVQFHPERNWEVPPRFDRLFEALVDRAAAYGRLV